MNSFSYDIKKEAALLDNNSQEEAISQLSSIIKTSGEIHRNSSGEEIVVKTEIKAACERINKILSLMYGKTAEISINTDLSFSKKDRYQINFPKDITRDILLDTEIMSYDKEKFLQFNSGISKYLIQEENTAISFIRGAFISCFSCNIVLNQEKNSGYHAEFVFSNNSLAHDFSMLLAEFDIISKIVERKNTYVVYIKDFEMISDLLFLVGAKNGALLLQNENVMRSMRNKVNRQTNCISGNLTKTVDASVREIEAINIIKDTIGLESLDLSLQNVAFLRLANPEESLDNLVKLSTEKISKSGVYHRLKKIEKIAKELK